MIFASEAHMTQGTDVAIFSMGCFWCGESEFRDHETGDFIQGIKNIRVGYAGGTAPNPTYESHEGYKEAVKVEFDPNLISYDQLLDIFWHNVDPFNAEGQFCDRGFPYTSAIFYSDETQKEHAEKTRDHTSKALGGKAIVTEIIPSTTFYDAEDYHQNYKSKNPIKYKYYRWNCGRDQRLNEIWKGKL